MADWITTYLTLIGVIALRYLLVAGIFYVLLWLRPAAEVSAQRLSARTPAPDLVRHEIKMSLLSSAIYALPGAIVLEAYRAGGTAIYTEVVGLLGWFYLPASALIYLIAHDAYFYWTHRAMHHPRLFRAMHLTHHRSREPTPWGAFSFHPWEAIVSAWLLPAMCFVVPIHVGVVFFLLILMTYCSVANHAGWEILPRGFVEGPLGRRLISARHHNLHHTNYQANFGLYFRYWDQACGTDRGLVEPISRLSPDAAPAE